MRTTKAACTRHVGKHSTVVGGIGLSKRGKTLGLRLPIEATAIDNDATQGGAVASEEFRGAVHYDVGAVLDGANEEGGGKGVVDDEHKAVAMCHFGHAVEMRNVAIGIAEGFGKHNLRRGLDGRLEGLEIVDVDYGVRDALRSERTSDEVEATAVEIVSDDDMIANAEDVLQSIVDRRRTARHGQGCYTALKGCDTLFEHGLGGVGQSAIDVASIAQGEAVGGMLRRVEHVGGCLIDGHSLCACGGVGLRLSGV